MVGEISQHRARSIPGGIIALLLYACPVDVRARTRKPAVKFRSQIGVGSSPGLVLSIPGVHPAAEPCFHFLIQGSHFGENRERLIHIAAKGLNRFSIRSPGMAQRLAVGGYLALERAAGGCHSSFPHHGFANDERGAIGFGDRSLKGLANLVLVVAVDCEDVPTPGLVFFGRIFIHHIRHLRRKLDVVGVVEHDHIPEAQEACGAACSLRDFLLNTAI